jgi:hypothetical protein
LFPNLGSNVTDLPFCMQNSLLAQPTDKIFYLEY